MMDPATLAAAVTAFLAPKLAEFGVTFLEEAGKKLWDNIMDKLKDRPAGAGSADEFVETPNDSDNQEAFSVQLRKLLKEDPEFAKELEGILKESEGKGQASVMADRGGIVTGDIQVESNGNIVIGSGNQITQTTKTTTANSTRKIKKKR
jgi:hypothetical protein